MFAVDVYERQKVLALIRRRAECAAPDQSLDFLSLHKAGFSRVFPNA